MKRINLIIAIAISAIMFSACEKEEGTINTKTSKLDKDYTAHDKSNSDPFEIYGIVHNKLLDWVSSQANFDDMSNEEVFYAAQEFSYNDFINDDNQNWEDFINSVNFTKELENYGVDISDTLISRSMMLSSEAPLYDSLVNIFLSAADSSTQQYLTTSQFISKVNNLENFIHENYSVIYDESTKVGNYPAMVLSMCSVAKSSYAYWMEVANNNNHPWSNRFDNSLKDGEVSIFRKIWHGIKVAWVDTRAFFNYDGGGGLRKRGLYSASSSAMV